MPDCDVAIVGAGPVGLLLASLLGARGLRVTILEKRTAPPAHSRAIGITPPSLEILGRAGLADAFVVRGVKIRDVVVHGVTGQLGICSFRELPGAHPFILSLPQQITLALLEQNLRSFSQVNVLRGREVTSFSQTAEFVTLDLGTSTVAARHVVACDGWRSNVRRLLGVPTRETRYPCHFVMGDFTDRSGMHEAAHLFFTAGGAVESFPLPGGIRRWIVQTSTSLPETPPGFISRTVLQRTGILLDPATQLNQSAFTPHRIDCASYHQGRVILCGDAAHAMSPIGGQGMNVGFADAALLAGVLTRIHLEGHDPSPLLESYQHQRQRAAGMAADRAAQGMGLGTWTGQPLSLLRDYLLRDLFLQPPLAGFMAQRFAMMDLPGAQA